MHNKWAFIFYAIAEHLCVGVNVPVSVIDVDIQVMVFGPGGSCRPSCRLVAAFTAEAYCGNLGLYLLASPLVCC